MKPDNAISETVSDNKRGRGRPRKYSDADYQKVQFLAKTSIRTKQNRIYAQRAVDAITSSKDAMFLIAVVEDTPQLKIKETVLAELGRFPDARSIVPTALRILSDRMSARAAVALIRRMRGAAKDPNYSELGIQLYKCIQRYQEQHPSLTDGDVKKAIEGASLFRVK